MLVRARIIDHGKLAFIRFTGSQTVETAVNELHRMRTMPDYVPGLPELVDLSGITDDNVDFNGMRRLARLANEEGQNSDHTKKIALFAPQDSIFGSARMFSTLVEMEPGHAEGQAFRTVEEALIWLGRPERRFADIPEYDLVPVD